MSDTGKYFNRLKDVTLSGNTFRLKGMGLAEILSDGEAGLKKKHLRRPKEYADAMDLVGKERTDFLLQWMKDNPESEGKELEEDVLDFAASAEGVEFILISGLSDQAGLARDEASAIVENLEPMELIELSSVMLGGWLDLGASAKKKPLLQRIMAKLKR